MVWLSARGGWGEVSRGGLPGLGCAASQASLLSPSRHTATFGLEPRPRCQGGSVVCRLQARLSPLWASAPHPGAFPTSPVPEALPSCPSLLLQPSGPVLHAAGGPARRGGRAGVWVWGGMGEKARRLSPGPEGVRGYPREEAGSKLPLIPWQLSEGGNVVCHFTATEVQLGPRRVPGNSGSSPWARSSSGFRHTACHLVRENECMRA